MKIGLPLFGTAIDIVSSIIQDAQCLATVVMESGMRCIPPTRGAS